MKKNRAFQTFYDEQSLIAQEIPEILDIVIEKLTKMRELDISSELAPDKLAEYSKQVKEAENQIRYDIASEKGVSEIEEQSNENR